MNNLITMEKEFREKKSMTLTSDNQKEVFGKTVFKYVKDFTDLGLSQGRLAELKNKGFTSTFSEIEPKPKRVRKTAAEYITYLKEITIYININYPSINEIVESAANEILTSLKNYEKTFEPKDNHVTSGCISSDII